MLSVSHFLFLSAFCLTLHPQTCSSQDTTTTMASASLKSQNATSASIELEFDETTAGPEKSFLDRIGWNSLQQKMEQAIRGTGQRWQELKPRFQELGNELKALMTNRTAVIESIQRFANSTGILVKIREKISESRDG